MLRYLLILFYLIPGVSALAEEIKLTAVTSKRRVAIEERFELTYSINYTETSRFIAPDLSSFNIISGPTQYYSEITINRKTHPEITIGFVLSGKKVGKFIIPPATVKAGRVSLKSNKLEIEVIKAKPGSDKIKQGINSKADIEGNLFVKAEVSKTSLHIGEEITVTYKLYSRFAHTGYDDFSFPSYNGFYAENLPADNNGVNRKETINGQEFTVQELRKTMLLPQKSGMLEIPSIEVPCNIPQEVKRIDPFDPFDPFAAFREVNVLVKSKPVKISVTALPLQGKPADFNGAVGQFTFDAKADNQKLKTGDPLKLTFTISGKGNLRLLESPKQQFPEELEVYDPKITDNIVIGEAGMSGSRSFEYVVIPRTGGAFLLGPFSFSYFDPSRNAYRTINSSAIPITVAGKPGDKPFIKSKDEEISEKSVREIKGIKSKTRRLEPIGNSTFFLSPLFYLSLLIFPVSLILLLILRRRSNERLKNKSVYRVKGAGSMAQRRLRKAQELLAAGNKDLFYEEIYRTLYGYLSDKLLMPVAELSRATIKMLLEKKNIPEGTIAEFLRILDACEFARFAPGASTEMDRVIKETEGVLNQTENYLK